MALGEGSRQIGEATQGAVELDLRAVAADEDDADQAAHILDRANQDELAPEQLEHAVRVGTRRP